VINFHNKRAPFSPAATGIKERSINTKLFSMTKILYLIGTSKQFLYFIVFSLALYSNASPLSAQTLVHGIVVDSRTEEPVIGATVVIKGTAGNGVVTDLNGEFILNITKLPVVIEVSYIGYKPEEIDIYEISSRLTIPLTENFNLLDEIVVVGYGTQKKSHLTGAVGSIRLDEEIAGRPVVELGQALYGQIPGVQVTTASGRPGSSSSLSVRGITSISAGTAPLIVIDGIPSPEYDLNLINYSDVASIEVLKDASSAAIYGSRGSNGVILITTRKLKSDKPKVTVNYLFGIQNIANKIPVMNAAEYAEAYKDAAQNGWIDSGGDPNAPNTYDARGQWRYTWPEIFNTPERLIDTDWQDAIFRTSPINKLDANISGGTDRLNYSLSGGIVDQQGIVPTSEYRKYSFSLKLSSKLNERIEVGGSANINTGNEREPYYRLPEWVAQYPSIYPVYAENGNIGSPSNVPGYENYYAILFRPVNGHPLYRIDDEIRHLSYNNIGNIYLLAEILPGLSFKTSLNYSYLRRDNSDYQSRDHNLGAAYTTVGNMIVEQQRIANVSSQNILSFDKTIKKHSISAIAGFEFDQTDVNAVTAQRNGYDNDLLHSLTAGKTVVDASDNIGKNVLISFLGRLNYSYNDKYLLSAAFRRDGSSRFAINNKWGSFPSVSAGWVISEENFLKESRIVSNLKLRVSLGFTGNNNFADYQWIGTVSQGKTALGNTLLTTYYPTGITNPDLKWERTKQYDGGFDATLFNNRIQLTLDYYYSTSDGLLLNVPVPAVSGFTQVFKNIGKLENKGLEFDITSYNIKNRDFSWSTKFNISGNRNKILEMGPDNAPLITKVSVASGMQIINKVGEEAFSFYGYVYDGVYKNQAELDADPARYVSARPGDGRYKNINNDDKLDEDDRTVIGNYNPDFIWGLTNNFTYKGLDLSFLFQGVQGSDIMDDNVHRSLMYHEGRNWLKEGVNRWRSEAEPGDGYHYRFTVDLLGYEKTPSSYWIRDGSYFKLKNLTLGYTFPVKWINRIGIASLRVYFNGQNLFTHKNAPVYDPEAFSGSSANAALRGINGNPYPSAKIYSFGININI
jgi:TonB-linked SusC/RagA family outer membrane protein